MILVCLKGNTSLLKKHRPVAIDPSYFMHFPYFSEFIGWTAADTSKWCEAQMRK